MADYCWQCTIDMFGVKGYRNDLTNLSTKDDTENKKYALTICEGCGPIQVDHTGTCISKDCLKKHNK
jgi:hypothetical protein